MSTRLGAERAVFITLREGFGDGGSTEQAGFTKYIAMQRRQIRVQEPR
jgi:hypothetical protein